LLALLLGELIGLLLQRGIARCGGGEDEPGELRVETAGGLDFALQFGFGHYRPEASVLLLALDRHELALLVSEEVHAVLFLAAATVPLRAGVPPDVVPQIEAERLEGLVVVRGFPTFDVGTHSVARQRVGGRGRASATERVGIGSGRLSG
jgi:hypothetical protein